MDICEQVKISRGTGKQSTVVDRDDGLEKVRERINCLAASLN